MTTQGPPPAESARFLRVDLHSHTDSSYDCASKPEDIIAACLRRNVSCLAVTDHSVIGLAHEVAAQAPFSIIIGEEIYTSEGEIIGLFLDEEIPARLTPEETVNRIKAQGGLAIPPHPFDRLRGSRLRPEALLRLANQFDAIEVDNSRTHFVADRLKAAIFAQAHDLPTTGGSDAHHPSELGSSLTIMPSFDGPVEFMESLRRSRTSAGYSSFLVHVRTKYTKYRKFLAGS